MPQSESTQRGPPCDSPGDQVTAVLNGRKQPLRIVGVVLSPEYIFQIPQGDLFPDDKRFGIFWMGYAELAAAFDMQGAFNDITLSLMPGASEEEVLLRLNRLTAPYGGDGAYGRYEQVSNRYLSDEIQQLQAQGVIAPVLFLSVAAFLLNVVLSRLISTQREQIAALKAFGYTHWEVGLHYMKQLAKDEHYQAIRTSLQRITTAENVLRITRYEAMEVLARSMRESGRPEPRDFGLTESGYNCMAQYVARAIAVGLFAKPPKQIPPPAPTR